MFAILRDFFFFGEAQGFISLMTVCGWSALMFTILCRIVGIGIMKGGRW